MQQAIAGLFTTEDVTARLRVKNAPKVDHATSLVTIKAASLRLAEYCDAGQHAYETGNLAEAQALSLALTHAANVISKFSFMLGQAIDAEMDQARTALGAA